MNDGTTSSIVSFQHCQLSTNILVFRIPAICPLCHTSLQEQPLTSPPIRFPSYLTDSRSHAYSVIIKPTNGTFLGNYKQGDNLHTGVTDSKGNIFHFNENGINCDLVPWEQCLSIPLFDCLDINLKEVWDQFLPLFIQRPEWRRERYHEMHYNCFDFVVSFLNYIQYNQHKRNAMHPLTRRSLIDEFIMPTTSRGAKYITLIKRIQQHGYVIQMDPDR